ncbi:MAG: NAD(P)-dependent oxidoreductase [Thermomicrobiales bacterium]|nr:NAD(P)-dependent oxidoreductase [Thermomicrobiales bacterium]
MPAERPLVLLTGAAGRIGTAFRQAMGERFRFRLADLRTEGLALTPGGGHEIVRLDVRDAAAAAEACAGAEAVIHLAADPSPTADWASSLLPVNVNGTLNVLRGALAAGCRRVVFASSAHAVAGYPPGEVLPADAPPRPINLYGVSKACGEATCACFAARGLSSLAVRIGAYEAPWLHAHPDPHDLRAYLSPRDLNDLLMRCLVAVDIDYAIVAGVSANHPNRFDLAATRTLLGYAPRDDGFRVFGVTPPS